MRDVALMLLVLGLFGLPAYGQVEIPEGFEIVEIVSSEYPTGFPGINNCGQIVFDQQLGADSTSKEIFLYDNGFLRRITENEVRDRVAEINDSGTMVWNRTMRKPNDDTVIYYEDGQETILDDNRRGVRAANINNLGHVAWARDRRTRCPYRVDVLLWDGERVARISERDDFIDQGPDLNDRDEIAWMHTDFCVNPWAGDIRLSLGGRTLVLPSNQIQVQSPTINNLRQVAWSANNGIEFWENGKTIVLTDWGGKASLNNLGDLYFWRWHEDIKVIQPWLYRVSEGDPRFYRLADDGARHGAGDINDWCEAVWDRNAHQGYDAGELFLRRIRTGDSEFDGDVDLTDYAVFGECMTGPGRVDRLCDCRFLDIDHDGDVDLGDFALFQNAFTGK